MRSDQHPFESCRLVTEPSISFANELRAYNIVFILGVTALVPTISLPQVDFDGPGLKSIKTVRAKALIAGRQRLIWIKARYMHQG